MAFLCGIGCHFVQLIMSLLNKSSVSLYKNEIFARMFLQATNNPRIWYKRKKKMASPCRGKRKLYVDDDGDWEEDRKDEEHEDEEGEAFNWSKPILIEEGRDYVRAR